MSSGADSDALIQEAADFTAALYVNVAALVIIVYDTLLTLSAEIEVLWSKKLRLAALLYFMARYPGIVCFMGYLIANVLSLDTKTCTDLSHFLDTLTLVPLIGIQGLVIARTYVISDQNRWVLVVLSLLLLGSLVPFIMDITIGSCDKSTLKLQTSKLESNIGSSMVMATDTAFIAFTAYYTLGYVKFSKGAYSLKGSTIGLLLKQGVLRYLFVLASNVAGIVVQATTRQSIGNILAPIRNALSALIICRFLLDIRQLNERADSNDRPRSLTSFRAATQYMRDMVVDEFGDGMPCDSSEGRIHSSGDLFL
ncbi:hypothetical protein K439DRAFT_1640303, partial [Ramaria rubella]